MRLVLALTVALVPSLALAQLNAAQCARRLSMTTGLYWRYQTNALGDQPQTKVRDLLAKPEAVAAFANFVNAHFNAQPGETAEDDSVIPAIKYVFANNLPWRDVFQGHFKFGGSAGYPTITVDPTVPALGYFNSPAWQKRYAGNEVDGWMLQAAFRTLQNTIGLKLEPSPVNGQGDTTATGRERPECRGCHYDSPYALDKVARLLPKRVGIGTRATVQIFPVTPQTLFNGVELSSHEQLVQTLITSDAFTFWSCRLAFEFAYGRPEHACEAAQFDRCADTLERTGSMKEALASILEDPAYCGGTP